MLIELRALKNIFSKLITIKKQVLIHICYVIGSFCCLKEWYSQNVDDDIKELKEFFEWIVKSALSVLEYQTSDFNLLTTTNICPLSNILVLFRRSFN